MYVCNNDNYKIYLRFRNHFIACLHVSLKIDQNCTGAWFVVIIVAHAQTLAGNVSPCSLREGWLLQPLPLNCKGCSTTSAYIRFCCSVFTKYYIFFYVYFRFATDYRTWRRSSNTRPKTWIMRTATQECLAGRSFWTSERYYAWGKKGWQYWPRDHVRHSLAGLARLWGPMENRETKTGPLLFSDLHVRDHGHT